MNKKFFYSTFAWGNIKKNGQVYFPYILACMATVAMYYIISFIAYDEGIKQMQGANSLLMMLQMGIQIIAIFGGIFLYYTNSFLIKRRKVELGLYNILGMEKKHIARVMLAETFLLASISIAGGIVGGILFSKLVMMCLVKMLKFTFPIVFSINMKAISHSLCFFGAVYVVVLISNIWAVRRGKPVELLGSANVGEKEPKGNVLLTLVGAAALGSGYYLSMTIESPIEAVQLFFVAVLLVILGTYCLFTSGSITILKLLRKNKKFYYKTNHFASVSGMIYRMKQNAAGLSNICILCTMVLITISTTVCMYLGVEEALLYRYPSDISMSAEYMLPSGFDKTGIEEVIKSTLKEQGLTVEKWESYDSLYMMAKYKDGKYENKSMKEVVQSGKGFSDLSDITFYTQQDYEKLTGEKLGLEKNQVAVYEKGEETADKFCLLDKEYTIARRLVAFGSMEEAVLNSLTSNLHIFVLADDKALEEIYNQLIVYDESTGINYDISIDVKETGDKVMDSCQKLRENTAPYDAGRLSWESRDEGRYVFLADFGGFLFIGIFFGSLFLMITVLIIYYKQISEGYDDRRRFLIMQKVGMSRKEVRHTIRTQILMVFMLPIATAVLHLAAAFPIVRKLLIMFNLTNIKLFIGCTIGTVLVFTLVYVFVYLMTSKTYYKIVEE